MRARSRFLLAIQIFTLATVLLPLMAFAQAHDPIQPAQPETMVLYTGTKLVIVDVTVHDKNGHPIHGLKREDFTLTESKRPQAVSSFEEYSSQTPPAAGPELPPMPPGTFTDYTPVPPNGALNILLLDTLNKTAR